MFNEKERGNSCSVEHTASGYEGKADVSGNPASTELRKDQQKSLPMTAMQG